MGSRAHFGAKGRGCAVVVYTTLAALVEAPVDRACGGGPGRCGMPAAAPDNRKLAPNANLSQFIRKYRWCG
jgi:hypothetical protein